MNNKKIIGSFFLLLSIGLSIFINPLITGNIIGNSNSEIGIKFSIVIFFILGVFFAVSLESKFEENGELTKSAKEEIKSAFNGWDGRKLTSRQKKLIKIYGLKYEYTGGNHNRFYYDSSPRGIIHSGSSSDHRAGLNLAHQLIRYIEENR